MRRLHFIQVKRSRRSHRRTESASCRSGVETDKMMVATKPGANTHGGFHADKGGCQKRFAARPRLLR